MKNFKNKILSVLLFAFSILIVHDYVVIDANPNYESSYTKSEKTLGDTASKVHAQIHLTMDVPRVEINIFEPISVNKQILNTQATATSCINPVLLRPPTT